MNPAPTSGFAAYPLGNNHDNSIGIGNNARPTASNQIVLGNAGITSIGGYAGWTNFSDGRYKINVEEDISGLDFISRLRPVSYNLESERLAADLGEVQLGNIDNPYLESSSIRHTGFIAQEVEQAAQESGFQFSGVDAPSNTDDFYGLRYGVFVVPLIKAVQEQQAIIESMQVEIERLRSVEDRLANLERSLIDSNH